MKPIILVAALLIGVSACSASGTQTTPSVASNVNATSWAITAQTAKASATQNVLATATFTYTQNQTINGTPAFCYLDANAINHALTYYVSESDTTGQYDTSNLLGAGTPSASNDHAICFAATTKVYQALAGGSYTLTLYSV